MKKLTALLMAAVFALSFFGCASKDAEKASAFEEKPGVAINIDGEERTMVAYNIKDNNYFKLRDIANVLKGTDAQFDVIWNESKGAIELVSGAEYSTDEELTSTLLQNPVATTSYVPIYKDGATVFLAAYNIADNNYFKLRDVAAAINFGVDWDPENQTIMIKTDEEYVYPASDSFGLNTRYLSYIGKTKAEVDAMHKAESYSYEFGMTTYDNGLMLGWGRLGEDPLDTDHCVSMYIPHYLVFDNCPDALTQEQIKSQFNASFSGYDEMYEENVLCVNYCGQMLFFYPDGGLYRDGYAFINDSNDYPNAPVESIQIINSAVSEPEPALPNNNIYYEYAVAHDEDFWEINQHWRDDRNYYNLADVDHDGIDEMVVKVGAGFAVFEEVDGIVQPIFFEILPESSGRDQYWLARYNGKDYVAYASASSAEYLTLYKITDTDPDAEYYSMIVNGNCSINSKNVSKSEYDAFKNSIEYPSGQGIDHLKQFKGASGVQKQAPSNVLGFYHDYETQSYFRMLYVDGKYHVNSYIVRTYGGDNQLVKKDDHTFEFYDYEGKVWTLHFANDFETVELKYSYDGSHVSVWSFEKIV